MRDPGGIDLETLRETTYLSAGNALTQSVLTLAK